jgi:hypothetical protein
MGELQAAWTQYLDAYPWHRATGVVMSEDVRQRDAWRDFRATLPGELQRAFASGATLAAVDRDLAAQYREQRRALEAGDLAEQRKRVAALPDLPGSEGLVARRYSARVRLADLERDRDLLAVAESQSKTSLVSAGAIMEEENLWRHDQGSAPNNSPTVPG